MDIPRRNTLRSQTADLIRRQLRQGAWTGPLPGEQTFAEQLHVSRVTVRLALAELKQEGLIAIVRHRYRPVPARGGAVKKRRRSSNPPFRVCYLCPYSLSEIMLRKLREIYDLQRVLHGLSIQLTLIPDPHLGRQRNPAPRLNALVAENRSTCWVLGLCPAPIQSWFSQNRIPAIISGSSHGGVDLPAFDWDHRAIGRHAAGLLKSRGHHRVALLTPERVLAGDLESEAGFFEVYARQEPAAPRPLIMRHDGTTAMIRQLVHSVFTRNVHPTALVALHATAAMTALTCLQGDGFRIPASISLISLQGDPALTHLVPAIAHYEWRTDLLIKRLVRAILDLSTGPMRPKTDLIMSRFLQHDSLGLANAP